MINEIMKRLSELPNVTMDDGQEYIQLYDAMETVKRALEQEPCEDAISRQAVHEAITRWAGSMSVLIALPTREVRPLLESIHKLPSVKPQEKTGHREYNDIYGHHLCENCKTIVMDYDNFCPNCGERMD